MYNIPVFFDTLHGADFFEFDPVFIDTYSVHVIHIIANLLVCPDTCMYMYCTVCTYSYTGYRLESELSFGGVVISCEERPLRVFYFVKRVTNN